MMINSMMDSSAANQDLCLGIGESPQQMYIHKAISPPPSMGVTGKKFFSKNKDFDYNKYHEQERLKYMTLETIKKKEVQ